MPWWTKVSGFPYSYFWLMTSIFKILSKVDIPTPLQELLQPTTSRAIPLFSSFYLFSVRRLLAFKVSVPSTPFFCRLFTWPSALMLAFRRCYTEMVSSEIPTSTWLLMTKVSFKLINRVPSQFEISYVQDLNPQPPHYECGALPLELMQQKIKETAKTFIECYAFPTCTRILSHSFDSLSQIAYLSTHYKFLGSIF